MVETTQEILMLLKRGESIRKNDREGSYMQHHKKKRSLTEIAWVEYEGSVHATEDFEKVSTAFRNLLPPTLNDVTLQQTELRGYHGNPVIFLNLRIENRDQIFKLMTHLSTIFNHAEKQKLAREVTQRIDPDNIFYLRVDKQKAYQGELIPAQGDNTILIKVKFRQYVKNSEKINKKLADLGLIEA